MLYYKRFLVCGFFFFVFGEDNAPKPTLSKFRLMRRKEIEHATLLEVSTGSRLCKQSLISCLVFRVHVCSFQNKSSSYKYCTILLYVKRQWQTYFVLKRPFYESLKPHHLIMHFVACKCVCLAFLLNITLKKQLVFIGIYKMLTSTMYNVWMLIAQK